MWTINKRLAASWHDLIGRYCTSWVGCNRRICSRRFWTDSKVLEQPRQDDDELGPMNAHGQRLKTRRFGYVDDRTVVRRFQMFDLDRDGGHRPDLQDGLCERWQFSGRLRGVLFELHFTFGLFEVRLRGGNRTLEQKVNHLIAHIRKWNIFHDKSDGNRSGRWGQF